MPRVKSNLKGNTSRKSIKSARRVATNQKPTLEEIEAEMKQTVDEMNRVAAETEEMRLIYQPETEIAETDDLAALAETQSQTDATAELVEKFPERAQHLNVYPSAEKIPANNVPQPSPTDSVATTDSIVTFLTPPPSLSINSGLGIGKGGAGRYKQSLVNKDQIIAKYGKLPANFTSKSPRVIQPPTAIKTPRLETIEIRQPPIKPTFEEAKKRGISAILESTKKQSSRKRSNPKRILSKEQKIALENKSYPDDELDLSWDPTDSESENEQLPAKVANSLMPILPFNRIIKEIAQEIHPDLRFQPIGLTLLREAAESYLTNLYNNSGLVAMSANRQTINVMDLRVAEKIMRAPYELVPIKKLKPIYCLTDCTKEHKHVYLKSPSLL